ncbi:hypothetical protein [Mangrovibrevibacter kandeliae]|uniref:hypothetical protein n=1 Tax=Mangrovibrevibacter kandeliae TaxID=2968473 RepID=UPI00211952B8|nr:MULTISPECIES: hypothetical protein [unclassified Aurantimonas]MCQ8782545.1 hypothetical protein [Aurantimonas sp. CSK15Z-1]MCW4114646.1 hypothetical protein [Aurantimonas sp. MSK8Z-1]
MSEANADRLRQIEGRLAEVRSAVDTALSGDADPVVADEIEALEIERDRLLTETGPAAEGAAPTEG